MRTQLRDWSCGAAALVNASLTLGKTVSEGKVRKLAGTTREDGTDERGIIDAARALGLTATPSSSSDSTAAWAVVRANLLDGRPCLLCIDNWGHWVTAIGIVGERVIIADPAETVRNSRENGIHVLRKTKLLKRWRHKAEETPYFSIAIGR